MGKTVKKKIGRQKVPIEFILDARRRYTCYYKRRAGVIKKLKELTILTGCEACLVIRDKKDRITTFTSDNVQMNVSDKSEPVVVKAKMQRAKRAK